MALEDALFAPLVKFRDELAEQGNVAIALKRYATFDGKRKDGTHRCPKCWMFDRVDSILGPTGRKRDREERYPCRRCDFEFYH
jgi:hypothetical protein